jgi:hypothetical protein
LNAGFYNSARTIHCLITITDALYIEALSGPDLGLPNDDSGPAVIHGNVSVYPGVYANGYPRFSIKAYKSYFIGFF